MRIACGIDIIEIDRIRKSIENLGEKFLKEIYTDYEIEYCNSKKKMMHQHYAARFAAKEACFKAISNMLENKCSILWKNIEILNDGNGRPNVHFIDMHFKQIRSIDVSISHCREYAIANIVILYEEE